nr:substance P-related peptide [Amia calva]
SKSHQFYGLM